MPRQFIIFDEKDMKELADGWLVHQDGNGDFPDMTFCTEEGYKKFLEFWGETEDKEEYCRVSVERHKENTDGQNLC